MAVTDEEKATLEEARASKTWRMLRLAARDKLSHFDRIDDGRALGALFSALAPSNSASAHQAEEQDEQQQGQTEAGQAQQPQPQPPVPENGDVGGAIRERSDGDFDGTPVPEAVSVVDGEAKEQDFETIYSTDGRADLRVMAKGGSQTSLSSHGGQQNQTQQQSLQASNAVTRDNDAVGLGGTPESSGVDSGVDARMRADGEE